MTRSVKMTPMLIRLSPLVVAANSQAPVVVVAVPVELIVNLNL